MTSGSTIQTITANIHYTLPCIVPGWLFVLKPLYHDNLLFSLIVFHIIALTLTVVLEDDTTLADT